MKTTPSKPEISADFHASIQLTVAEVEISDVKEYAQTHGFREQTSRHITIIGSLAKDELRKQPNLACEVNKLLASFDWSFTIKDVYHVKKAGTFGEGSTVIENRESIIRTIDMPTIELFYQKLNELLGANLPTQFPHITLFTKGDREDAHYRGIPIPSEVEFAKLEPIKIPR
jgi:hypothetical protein